MKHSGDLHVAIVPVIDDVILNADGATSPISGRSAPGLIYHFVVDGSARVSLDGEPDIDLAPGDVVLFPHGDPHCLSSGSGSNQIDGPRV